MRKNDYRFESVLFCICSNGHTPLYSNGAAEKVLLASECHIGIVDESSSLPWHMCSAKATPTVANHALHFIRKKCWKLKFRFSDFFSFYRHSALFSFSFPARFRVEIFGSAFGCEIIEMKSFRFICRTHMISLLYSPSIIDIYSYATVQHHVDVVSGSFVTIWHIGHGWTFICSV